MMSRCYVNHVCTAFSVIRKQAIYDQHELPRKQNRVEIGLIEHRTFAYFHLHEISDICIVEHNKRQCPLAFKVFYQENLHILSYTCFDLAKPNKPLSQDIETSKYDCSQKDYFPPKQRYIIRAKCFYF